MMGIAKSRSTHPRKFILQSHYLIRPGVGDNKMSVHIQPLSEITNRATRALVKELGAVDTLRFLSQFSSGGGNYTSEREQLFAGESVTKIVADIKAQRK
jgi:hypothetical protein